MRAFLRETWRLWWHLSRGEKVIVLAILVGPTLVILTYILLVMMTVLWAVAR